MSESDDLMSSCLCGSTLLGQRMKKKSREQESGDAEELGFEVVYGSETFDWADGIGEEEAMELANEALRLATEAKRARVTLAEVKACFACVMSDKSLEMHTERETLPKE